MKETMNTVEEVLAFDLRSDERVQHIQDQIDDLERDGDVAEEAEKLQQRIAALRKKVEEAEVAHVLGRGDKGEVAVATQALAQAEAALHAFRPDYRAEAREQAIRLLTDELLEAEMEVFREWKARAIEVFEATAKRAAEALAEAARLTLEADHLLGHINNVSKGRDGGKLYRRPWIDERLLVGRQSGFETSTYLRGMKECGADVGDVVN